MAERVGHLHECQGLSTYRTPAVVGIGRQRVGRLLHRAGVPVKAAAGGEDAYVNGIAVVEDLRSDLMARPGVSTRHGVTNVTLVRAVARQRRPVGDDPQAQSGLVRDGCDPELSDDRRSAWGMRRRLAGAHRMPTARLRMSVPARETHRSYGRRRTWAEQR